MAENKFVVKTVFHDENGDTLLWLCRTFWQRSNESYHRDH